jgi:hypothetical protein
VVFKILSEGIGITVLDALGHVAIYVETEDGLLALITVPSNHHTLSNTNSPWIPIT